MANGNAEQDVPTNVQSENQQDSMAQLAADLWSPSDTAAGQALQSMRTELVRGASMAAFGPAGSPIAEGILNSGKYASQALDMLKGFSLFDNNTREQTNFGKTEQPLGNGDHHAPQILGDNGKRASGVPTNRGQSAEAVSQRDAGASPEKAENAEQPKGAVENANSKAERPTGPLTDALDKWYETFGLSKSQSELLTALNNSGKSPDQLCADYKKQDAFGNPPVEGTGNKLNIYDRENNQHQFSYDAASKTYKYEGAIQRGGDGYTPPERRRDPEATATANKIAEMFEDEKLEMEDIGAQAAKLIEATLNKGVPLDKIVESLNQVIEKGPTGRNPVTLDAGRRGSPIQTLSVHPGHVGGFPLTIEYDPKTEKYSVQYDGSTFR